MGSTFETTVAGRVGRDLWPAGRLVRVLAGLLLLTTVVVALVTGELGSSAWLVMGKVALAGVTIAIVYTVLVALIGDRVLARVDPWLGAIILLAPPALLYFIPSVPSWLIVGFFLYTGAAMLVQALLNYGGCEIAGIPSLVLRRRYTVYCALNGADLVERALRGRSKWAATALALVVFIVVVAAQVGVEAVGGKTSAFWPAYLAFLIVGFAIKKIAAAWRSAHQTPKASPSA